jgi:hypothetical protein
MMSMEMLKQRRVSEMATKAYFLIRVGEDFKQNGYAGWLKDLESMPEVQYGQPAGSQDDGGQPREAPACPQSRGAVEEGAPTEPGEAERDHPCPQGRDAALPPAESYRLSARPE